MTLKTIIACTPHQLGSFKFFCRYHYFIDHYSIAYHRGSLTECISTEKTISLTEFLMVCDAYYFYGYDERIGAFRFLLVNMKECVFMPTWLHIYIDINKLHEFTILDKCLKKENK